MNLSDVSESIMSFMKNKCKDTKKVSICALSALSQSCQPYLPSAQTCFSTHPVNLGIYLYFCINWIA